MGRGTLDHVSVRSDPIQGEQADPACESMGGRSIPLIKNSLAQMTKCYSWLALQHSPNGVRRARTRHYSAIGRKAPANLLSVPNILHG